MSSVKSRDRLLSTCPAKATCCQTYIAHSCPFITYQMYTTSICIAFSTRYDTPRRHHHTEDAQPRSVLSTVCYQGSAECRAEHTTDRNCKCSNLRS